MSPGRRKQVKPKQTWKDGLLAIMGKKDMTDGDWIDNKLW